MEIPEPSKATKVKKAKRRHEHVILIGEPDSVRQSGVEGMISSPLNQKLRKKPSKHIAFSQISTKERDQKSKPPVAEVDNSQKAKKRTRKDTESEAKESQSRDNSEVIQQPPTKKRKNRTEFADPRDDSALNHQSRKALEYAFMQMNKPSKWKFNKAQQNWIIRNLWSPEALPEKYFSLTLKYLYKVQGGSRTKLIDDARTILHPKETEKSSGKTARFVEPETETTTRIRLIRGPLISMDLTPRPFLDSKSVSASNETARANRTNAIAEIKKVRAQKILDVLSSNNDNA